MRARVVSHDLGGLLARSDAARDAALGVVAHNVLADCTPYVPYETGALQASGQALQEGDHWVVEWGGDGDTAEYARVQYYDAGLSHDTPANAAMAPSATDHWYEKCRSHRWGVWGKMFKREYEGRLRA